MSTHLGDSFDYVFTLFMKVFFEWYWRFGGDFTFVIYKTCDKGLQCPKWAKKDLLQQYSKNYKWGEITIIEMWCT